MTLVRTTLPENLAFDLADRTEAGGVKHNNFKEKTIGTCLFIVCIYK